MILDKIIYKKRGRIIERKKILPEEVIKAKAFELSKIENKKPFKNTLKSNGLSIIGEFKKASPSKGIIVKDFNIDEISKYYAELGADVFSVLTEEDFFMGKDDYLKKVKSSFDKPVLRKDFIVDFYQIYESKLLGADVVLLIVSVLKENLKSYYDEVLKYGMEALVEVHNKEELDIALECGCEVIGINNRDLSTFNVSLDTTKDLLQYIPSEKIVVSESGIASVSDLIKLQDMGVNAALVGELFMRNINNKDFIEDYKRFRESGN